MAARAVAQASAAQRVLAARRVPLPAAAAAPRAPPLRTRCAVTPHVAQRNAQLSSQALPTRAHAVAQASRKPRGRPRRTSAAPARRALPRWAALPALGGFLLTWGLSRLASPPSASADLGEAGGALGSIFSALVVAGVLAGLALSAAPLLGPPPPPLSRAKRSAKSSAADAEADAADLEVTWTLAGVVALIPFTNWVAWLGLALDIDTEDSAGTTGAQQDSADASRRVRYLAFAALYALPYLHSGLSVDALDVVAVLACAAHVQLERIAVTEPRTRLLGGGEQGGEGSLDEWARALRDVADAAAAAGGQKAQEAPSGKQRGRRKAASASAADVAETAQAAAPAAAALARAAGARVAALTAALAALRDEFEEARCCPLFALFLLISFLAFLTRSSPNLALA